MSENINKYVEEELRAKKEQIKEKWQQIKERLKNVKTQAELDGIIGDAVQIFQEGLREGPDLDLDISGITQASTAKTNNLLRQIVEERRIDNEAEKNEAIKEITRQAVVDEIYSAFDAVHEEYLARQKEENKNLKAAADEVKAGKGISHETKAKLAKSQEQIDKEKEHWEKINRAHQTADAEHKYHDDKIKEIDKHIQAQPPMAVHLEKKKLEKKRHYHKERKETAKEIKAKAEEHYQVRKERAELIELFKQNAAKGNDQGSKDFIAELEKEFLEIHGIPHEQVVQDAHSVQRGAKYPPNMEKEVLKIKDDLNNGKSKEYDNKGKEPSTQLPNKRKNPDNKVNKR